MISAAIPATLQPMIEGSPIDSMEVAKAIVGEDLHIDPNVLAHLAKEKTFSTSARVAAVYALGYVAETEEQAAVLRDILADQTDDLTVREHAAEDLGNLGDKGSLTLLQNVLAIETSEPLRASCRYAIEELNEL